jgi:hypothetical protein
MASMDLPDAYETNAFLDFSWEVIGLFGDDVRIGSTCKRVHSRMQTGLFLHQIEMKGGP